MKTIATHLNSYIISSKGLLPISAKNLNHRLKGSNLHSEI